MNILKTALVVFVSLLCGVCGALTLPTTLRVQGQIIQVRQGHIPGGHAGSTVTLMGACHVTVRDPADVFTLLHEVGHCADDGVRIAELNAYACRVRHYACEPDEAAADLYALGYLLRYGPDLQPLISSSAPSAAQSRAQVSQLLDREP